LRTATRVIEFQRRLIPVSKSALVCFSAKLLITPFSLCNGFRYTASVMAWPYRFPAIEKRSRAHLTRSAYRPHAAPAGAGHEALRRNIIAQVREIGSRGPDVSEDQAAALVDEAFAEIRSRRE
jgi:hypothetical protein